ncbi:hypothetical protein BT63DRAFT_420429 [Microthyrium microscopicum]|uniref:Uncharacterized protein n=1 Tax=Microthyrium microscopicum TaxID=703497 RepID=A0A6A6USE9_9PEZI|nr:hypothetical protein BT63DRAFT_420429 [Microthyrium microscopicum]
MASETTQPPVPFAVIQHWSIYGQRGESSTSTPRATKPDGALEMTKPTSSPWDLVIPQSEIVKVLNGFDSQQMEDKWDVYTTGPDVKGVAVVHMLRSWTGFTMGEVKVQLPVEDDGKLLDGDAVCTEIVWDAGNEAYTETMCKDMAKGVCEWVLGVKFAGESVDG